METVSALIRIAALIGAIAFLKMHCAPGKRSVQDYPNPPRIEIPGAYESADYWRGFRDGVESELDRQSDERMAEDEEGFMY